MSSKLTLSHLDYLSANAFRDLKTNLEHQLKNKSSQIAVITSANQGEGKSYVSLNLALAFAESDKKVLLIDLDLHRPRTSKSLGIFNRSGVSNIYEDQNSQDFVVKIQDNLFALSCGRSTLNITEVISSKVVNDYINEQTNEFDIVLIDSPPVRLSSDTKIIISNFKNTLFVVKENKTRSDEIEESLENIKLVNPIILGMVLNGRKISGKERKKYGYGYGYN